MLFTVENQGKGIEHTLIRRNHMNQHEYAPFVVDYNLDHDASFDAAKSYKNTVSMLCCVPVRAQFLLLGVISPIQQSTAAVAILQTSDRS